jgi:hypothetical protein
MKIVFKVLLITVVAGFFSCGSKKNDQDLHKLSDYTINTLTLSSTYNNISIAAYDTHFYLFTTDATGGGYTISLTNLASNCGWSVYYYDASYVYAEDMQPFDLVTGSKYTDTTSESGPVTFAANTKYYILVDEWGKVNSSYTLTITKP